MQITKNKNKTLNIKLNSFQIDKTIDLQLQLKEAKTHIQYLKKVNESLLHQISHYERKCEDIKLMEEELQFRKQQEKQMQEHLDNYYQINEKLRQQVITLSNKLKNERQYSQLNSQRLNTKKNQQIFLDQNGSINGTRRSLGGTNQKENHPITPKARVNLHINPYISMKNQIDLINKINGKKVFL